MAKRSPILGYNHNVRYRGLVFHVQTEDSGVMAPHLFTHLFHHGVIVSTRKLVYDSGSAEEAIKALMQAQHKAVLKELKRGQFDDKIDEYLGGTPGLLARGAPDDAASEIATEAMPRAAGSDVMPSPPPVPAPRSSAPMAAVAPPERPSAPRFAAHLSGIVEDPYATVRTEMPDDLDSAPEIVIQLEVDDSDEFELPRARNPRDTDASANAVEPDDYPRSTLEISHLSDGVPRAPLPGAPTVRNTSEAHTLPPDRRSSTAVGAASLPPARPITRPPSRPALPAVPRSQPADPRAQLADATRADAAAFDLYVPSELAPERPGQYSQHKRISTRIPAAVVREARPAAETRPPPTAARPIPPTALRTPPSSPPPNIGDTLKTRAVTQPQVSGFDAMRNGPPTPRTLAPAGARTSPIVSQHSGVVMTRPAVIVGGPAKSAPTTARIRKAREDEGRGFGQGLISEKSLDEVILAYLSEDAEDK